MLHLQRTYAALPLALILYACESDDAGAARRPRLVIRHPAASGDESPPRMVAPPEPPSPEQLRLTQLRQQPRAHVAVAVGGQGAIGSALLVPLPSLSLDVGAQLRDVFAVYAMTRVSSLVFFNYFTYGVGFEWVAIDLLSLGVGIAALTAHAYLRSAVWGNLLAFPIFMNIDVPTTSRPNVVRDSVRIAIEFTLAVDPRYPQHPTLLLAAGLGYARR